MRRWALNIFAGLSLILCVITAAMWVRSYFVTDGWFWSDGVRLPTAGYEVAWRKLLVLHHGGIYFIMDRTMGSTTRPVTRLESSRAQFAAFGITPKTPTTLRELFGFVYRTDNGYPFI